MIECDEIKHRLLAAGGVDFIEVKGDGYHYELIVVADHFIDKSRVARQQWVYAQLKDYITAGDLHALSMKTLTKQEWEKQHG